ncbi:MAG TPA: hypothetical protein VE029_13705 [Rhizobacter sp.]|nr:hypothetical protein [Rhizobacter sp.]
MMKLPRGFAWFVSVALRRRARSTPCTDFGDMGTAFGLDASLSPESQTPDTRASPLAGSDMPRSSRPRTMRHA